MDSRANGRPFDAVLWDDQEEVRQEPEVLTKREFIDDTKGERISLEDQIGEAIESYAYIVMDNAAREARGGHDALHGIQRRKRRAAILATLKWLQENRAAVLAAHQAIREASKQPDES